MKMITRINIYSSIQAFNISTSFRSEGFSQKRTLSFCNEDDWGWSYTGNHGSCSYCWSCQILWSKSKENDWMGM